MNRCGLFPVSRSAKIVVALMFVSITGVLRAADVSYFAAIKAILYQQTNQPSPQMLSTNPCLFTALVVASTNNAVTNATMKPSNATPSRRLLADTNEVSWRFEEYFQSQAAMDAVYPAGSAFSPVTYNFAMYGAHDGLRTGGVNFFLLIIPVSYPPTPEITNLDAAQSIDNTRDFTLRWNSLGGSTISIVQLSVLDLASNVVFTTPLPFQPGALDGTSTSATIPANTLPAGSELLAHLSVGNPSLPNTNSYPGATGVASLGKDTEFRLITRPAPAPPTLALNVSGSITSLSINGEAQRLYQVQASPDLLNWTTLNSFYATVMPTNYTEAFQPGNLPRYFRVKLGD